MKLFTSFKKLLGTIVHKKYSFEDKTEGVSLNNAEGSSQLPGTNQSILSANEEITGSDINNTDDVVYDIHQQPDDNQISLSSNEGVTDSCVNSIDLLIRPTGKWHTVAEAVVGLSHRRADPPLPCQDAFSISNTPRVTLIVADGAGSAAVSEIGANAVVSSCHRLLYTLEDLVYDLLDNENEPEPIVTKRFALRLVQHAMGTLEDISKQYRREIRDFRCTLLALVVGKERLLWIKVGDGALIVEDKGELRTLGEVLKGEFANQTTFIDDKLIPDSVQFGTASTIYVSGLSAMSDGAAERLVSNDGSRVASKMSEFFNQLRKNSLNRTQITNFFHDKEAWRETSGDDKCLALAARQCKTALKSFH